MQAGIAKNKNCNNFYDCNTCKYDQGMQKRVADGKQISWQDAMRKRPDIHRTCRHTLTQRIDYRTCSFNYNCSKCDFDQFFEEVWHAKTKSLPFEEQSVKGFNVPMDYFFHNGHTWARIESGGYIRIGLDDFALKLLGKADAFNLPLMGNELDRDRAGWGLRRQENHADVLSPVDGVIVEVNAKVRENPELANREPYGDGWLFLVRPPSVKASVKKLMSDTESLNWISREVEQLEGMIEEVAGPLAADGGYLHADIYGNIKALGWENLTRTFLKT
jgi:glycine cleavage system H lipoate-binding protein